VIWGQGLSKFYLRTKIFPEKKKSRWRARDARPGSENSVLLKGWGMRKIIHVYGLFIFCRKLRERLFLTGEGHRQTFFFAF